MVQVYADGVLIYDSRIQELALLGLTIETGLEIAGAASIIMPPDHFAYGSFISYRTEVTIYRDNLLLFRGRPLYPSDDFLRRRTITCEGERCFLRDGVMRPYMLQGSPADLFAYVIGLYNAQVEAFKQFKVGTVTVTDPNDYISLENESAESFADTVVKLVERCGGYITFTTDGEGDRCINWLADVGYANNQVVEFGENLLDFSRTGENTDLATVIVPYGAKDEISGARITIESVNEGLDFIQDNDAVALRGVVAKAVYWDDITEPANLLTKARQYLNESKQAITSLVLTAVDLSIIDKNIDSFRVGDIIRVRSRPHGVDDDYRLTDRKMDLLNPAADRITLGKSLASLTGADAAGDRRSSFELQKIERSMVAGYTLDVAAQIEAVKVEMTSLIQQTGDAIQLEVREQYATNDAVTSAISTSMTQLADQFEFLFTELQTTVDANDAEAREHFDEIEKYIRFIDGNIILGEEGNEITLRIENDRISFLDAGAEVAYFSNQHLTVVDGSFLNSLQVGKFAFLPRENGNLSLVKVGD
jgi:phage minor structural protein